MSVPSGSFRILKYWEFYDFPRYILAEDSGGRLWLFEGSFDDELDSYPDSFIFMQVDAAASDAISGFEARSLIPLGADRSRYRSVALSRVKFDESRRESFEIS